MANHASEKHSLHAGPALERLLIGSDEPAEVIQQEGIQCEGQGFELAQVLFQFLVSRWLRGKAPFLMMAFGTLFYMIGFTMFGFVANFWLFAGAIIVVTIGEMIVVPVSQGLAANFAPEEMRGRYMAVFGLSWAIPSVVSLGLAGYILDNFNPNLLWYIGGVLCALSALSYYALHLRLGKWERFIPKPVAANYQQNP